MPNFIGWLVGIFVGFVLIIAVFVALALPLPPFVGFLAAVVAAITAVVGTVTSTVALILAGVLLTSFYLWAYAIATSSVAVALPAVTLPLAARVPTPTGGPVALPDFAGELFARGVMIGQTAILNAAILTLVPIIGPVLAIWAFIIGSLAAVILVSQNRIFHGFLGWSAWLFPMSYLATVVGLLLFLVSLLIGPLVGLPSTFRIDWTTGVVETNGGFCASTGFSGGFSLGNFNFITSPAVSGSFFAPSIPSHETGHTLNTAAMSGVVLWINAFDENPPTLRRNLAYGELTAESHAQSLAGVPRNEFFVRLWS
jgi:hypothetical protein